MKLALFSCALIAVLLLGPGCGGDDGGELEGGETPSNGATQPSEQDSDGTPLSDSNATTITAIDFEFRPTEPISAAPGVHLLTLNNMGQTAHTLTLYQDEARTTPLAGADTGEVAAGASADLEITFEPGTYYLQCDIHPQEMNGSIVVAEDTP